VTARLFPPGFTWGAATSSFQIEGSTLADGRGPTIWDTFCLQPGAVFQGDSGEPGADHYLRYKDDVALMKDLGLRAYRFSIAWSRIQPTGVSPVNEVGLDFYRSLVDELLSAGIEPWLTLHHWDLPQGLQDVGGWEARDCVHRFADFAEIVATALGDRVPHFATINEPWCAAFLGYAAGIHAPGICDGAASIRVAHHLLLGHGLAVSRIRAAAPSANVGIVLNPDHVRPANPDSPSDCDAVRRIDGLRNRWWLDSLLLGQYPEDVLADVAAMTDGRLALDAIRDGDLAVISNPIDELGINYYCPSTITTEGPHDAPGPNPYPTVSGASLVPSNGPVTDLGWPVEPATLTSVLQRITHDYPNVPPMVITENGAAYDDPFDDRINHTGEINDVREINDHRRTSYLAGHIEAVADAIETGVDVRGYFAWSLVDNFEWHDGYRMRFGIVHVDYTTQVRTPRASAKWYASHIESQLQLTSQSIGTHVA
jgi:beta-glucosidase